MLCIVVRGGQENIVRLGKMINIQSFSPKYLVVSKIMCNFVFSYVQSLYFLYVREVLACAKNNNG